MGQGTLNRSGAILVLSEYVISTATYIPVEVYLNSSYEPDAEYVDGEIEERPMGRFDHSSWQLAILKWFLRHESGWNIRVRPELRLRISPSRYRVPDVVLLDRDQPVEQIITRPPLAVFEVLSPEDTLQRLKRKLDDYAAMGIPQIWVIDPQDGTFYRYDQAAIARRGGLGSVKRNRFPDEQYRGITGLIKPRRFYVLEESDGSYSEQRYSPR